MPTKRKPGRPKGSKNRKRPATKAREPRTLPAAKRRARNAAKSGNRPEQVSTPPSFVVAPTQPTIPEHRRFRDSQSVPTPDPYARPLALPTLPAGLKIGSKMTSKMAMDDAGNPIFPYQGYLSGFPNSIGAFSLYFPGYPYLAMLTQRSEFRQPVETHAKDMTREWIEFTTHGKKDKAKKIEEIKARFEDLKIQSLFREALVHDGFYGVGHIAVDMKRNGDTELPLVLDPKTFKKGSLRAFRNIEPMWVTPVMWNGYDPLAPTFYKPETWVALSRTMHASRIKQVISREVPDLIKPAYNFGGISMSQLIEPYVDRWLKTVSGVNRLINNFSLIILKTNMQAVLSGEPDGDLLRRLQMARKTGDNMGAFALDKNEEELEQIAVPLSGLAELQQQAVDHMAYPTHLPLVVLTGVTPSGLNATSEGEIEVYHDWNRSEQNAVIRSPLKWVLDIVQLDLYGEIDDEIGFEFRPIKQLTGEALANIKRTEAERDVAMVEIGAIGPDEVREKIARDKDSGFVNLDAERMPKPLEEPPEAEGEGGKLKPAGELVREAA